MTLRHALAVLALLLPTPLAAHDSAVAVTRSVEADGTTTLVHEATVPAAADAVWQAVSTADGWMTWAVPIAWADPAAGTLETSYNPAAQPGDQGGAQLRRARRLHEHARALQVVGTVHAGRQQKVALQQRAALAEQPHHIGRPQLGRGCAHPWDRSTWVTTGRARSPATTRPR